MRGLRRATPGVAVSLFPFLAVLLCTMGALIVVLVVIVRQAPLEASAVDGRDEQRRVELERRVSGLRAERDDVSRQLAGEREQLSRLEGDVRRLAAQLAELEGAAQQLRTGPEAGWRQPLEAELAELGRRADDARRQLAKAVEAAGNSADSFAIIPYDGKRGTRRRPIYLECRADSVVFQPEGIVLTEDDFRGPLGPGNPLAAGLRAADEHLAHSRPEGSLPGGDPYPLLLVRPDGILAYAAARAAMRSWGDDFGYELIDSDWPLAFPPADTSMASQIQAAVESARRRQQMLARSAPREWRSYDAPSFRAIPPRGSRIAEGEGAGDGGERGAAGLADSPRRSRTTGAVVGIESQESPLGGRFGDRMPSAGAAAENAGTFQGGSLRPEGGRLGSGSGDGLQAGSDPGEPTGAGSPDFGPSGADTSPSRMMRGGAGLPGGQSLGGSGRLDWALPDAASDSVGVTRPITIVCERERLVLLDDKKSTREATIVPLAERTEDSLDDVVSAVWQRIDSWGIAGRGMHWRPLLSVQVRPGGEQRFEDIQALLADSGLDVRAAASRATAIQYPRTKTPD